MGTGAKAQARELLQRQVQQQLMHQAQNSAGHAVSPVVVINPAPAGYGAAGRVGWSRFQVLLAVSIVALGYYGLRNTWHTTIVPLLRRWLLQLAGPLELRIAEKSDNPPAADESDGIVDDANGPTLQVTALQHQLELQPKLQHK